MAWMRASVEDAAAGVHPAGGGKALLSPPATSEDRLGRSVKHPFSVGNQFAFEPSNHRSNKLPAIVGDKSVARGDRTSLAALAYFLEDFHARLRSPAAGRHQREVPHVKAITQAALEAGTNPQEILDQGLIPAMDRVGQKFASQEFFVPEMLIAALAMQAGIALLKPGLPPRAASPAARW